MSVVILEMSVRQLMFDAPGHLRWEQAPEPVLPSPDAALVRPLAVATCDLDTAILRGRAPRFVGPYPFGHECVAEVIDIGDAVDSVVPGDRVAVPFQISCGSCVRCRGGHPGHCASYEGINDYGLGPTAGGWQGFLCDLVAVPHADAMLVGVPDHVDPVAVASLSDNLPDAYRTVRPISEHPGADVLIVAGGAPSIGLYGIGLAAALGAGTVTYVDSEEQRCAAAESLGARIVHGRPDRLDRRYPVTVDASGRVDGLSLALRSTDVGGTCTSVGIYWVPPTIPFLDMYLTSMTFVTGIVEARTLMPEVLTLIADGRYDPTLPITRRVDWDDVAVVLEDPPHKTIITPNVR